MRKMRIPLLIALGVAVIGIILGSFLDLQLSNAIASSSNNFALAVSAIGPTIGFFGVAVIGGGFIALIVKGKYHIALKILFGVCAAACLGVSVYFPGGEYFGINGFYQAAPKIVGYIIAFVPEAAVMVGGYFLFKDFKNKNIWIVFILIAVLLTIALVAILPTIKDSMRRPRFRFIHDTADDLFLFHNWWESCKDWKEIMTTYGLDPNISDLRDHFKSFPSGHTAEASILFVTVTFVPLAHEKFQRYQLPAFLGSCALVLLVAFARIMAAAHYLSDVSWGATIVLALTVIANEVVMRIKPLQLEETAKE